MLPPGIGSGIPHVAHDGGENGILGSSIDAYRASAVSVGSPSVATIPFSGRRCELLIPHSILTLALDLGRDEGNEENCGSRRIRDPLCVL